MHAVPSVSLKVFEGTTYPEPPSAASSFTAWLDCALATTGASFIQVGDTPSADRDSSEYGAKIIDILDYANINKNVTVMTQVATAGQRVYFSSGLWVKTGDHVGEAVDRIRLFNYSNNYVRGSSFTLYGIQE